MRLWSLHPSYLDGKALLAAWREGLLAQKVLAGETTGYRHHPQLERFKAATDPMRAIAVFLQELAAEADRRGYSFDRDRIRVWREAVYEGIPVTQGQVDYERMLLVMKLEVRGGDRDRKGSLVSDTELRPNRAFYLVPGAIAHWEKTREDVLERLRGSAP